MVTALDIRELNAAHEATVVAALAPLFEGAPRFLARLVAARPFGDWPALFGVAREIAHAMPENEQVELIDAHPRLGAPPATVSALSFREQGYDRATAEDTAAGGTSAERAVGTAELERQRVAAELERLNEAYEARFGFRYCVFVAGRSRAELLPQMVAALDADRDDELHRALDAVVDISMARLETLRAAGT
ncbi:MAG: hypothetical protein C0498_11500 [Anaerolinea sp.]|nr:hypothetical protein [Anaerolinea sp.]